MRNLLTLKAFADWCERKPADERYQYVDIHNCACGQYAEFLGISYWPDLAIASDENFWRTANDVAGFPQGPRTFGALAKRLREAAS